MSRDNRTFRYSPRSDNNKNLNMQLDYFYQTLEENISLANIDAIRVMEIKNSAVELNSYYTSEGHSHPKAQRYVRVSEKLRTSPKKYNVENDAEKLLMLMFAVDPEFDALVILEKYNKAKDIKTALAVKFGIADINLIKIEKMYAKKFFGEKAKQKIKERVYN